MYKKIIYLLAIIVAVSCSESKKQDKILIDEDKLGFIDADVASEETNLKSKAEYEIAIPGESEVIERSFENAPPLIPHTTVNFFPITIKNNICFSCHLPEKAEEVGAIELPETHFTDLRPELEKKGGIYYTTFEGEVAISKTNNFDNAYFNCSQCHVPQAEVSADIENLFTAEFRNALNRERSGLKDQLTEGISK
ncbi:MAG: nitrate reductase cytochrome c-type subunit [Bacteroidota bacterium]